MNLKITQKIALGLLVSGIAFTGMSFSTQAAQSPWAAALADQPGFKGVKVTHEDADALFKGDSIKLVAAHKGAAVPVSNEHVKFLAHTARSINASGQKLMQSDVPEALEYTEQLKIQAGGDPTLVTPVMKEQVFVNLQLHDQGVNDFESSDTIQKIYANLDYVKDEAYKTPQGKKNIAKMAHPMKIANGGHLPPIADVKERLPFLEAGCPRHFLVSNANLALHQAAKAQLEARTHAVKITKPTGLDISTLAACTLSGIGGNPTEIQFAFVQSLLKGLSADKNMKKVEITAELVDNAVRINTINPAVSKDTLGIAKFTKQVVDATYLEEELNYPAIDPMVAGHKEFLEQLDAAIQGSDFYDANARNYFAATPVEYVDALMQLNRAPRTAAILGAARPVTTLDVMHLSVLREINAERTGLNPEANTVVANLDADVLRPFVKLIHDNPGRFFPENVTVSARFVECLRFLRYLGFAENAIQQVHMTIADTLITSGAAQNADNYNATLKLASAEIPLAEITRQQIEAVAEVRADLVGPDLLVKLMKFAHAAGNAGYVPGGLAICTNPNNGGNVEFRMLTPLEAIAGGYTLDNTDALRRTGVGVDTILVAPANVPNRADGHKVYKVGNIVAFDDLDRGAGALSTFTNGNGAINKD